MNQPLRDAEASEIGAIAALWHAAWHDAHDALVPEALVRLRTRASFEARAERHRPRMRVAGPLGRPSGLCVVEGGELSQMFVAPAARGTCLAAALLHDAEARLRGVGHRRAWLACAIGNDRAARF